MMVKSMSAAALVKHLTLGEDVLCDGLVRMRNALKSEAASRGIRLSYMPFIIKATSLALAQYPQLNATVSSDVTEMIYHYNHNIGIAMDTPKGLIVPVIKAVQEKSIFDIALELATLQEAAINGTIKESQLSGGSFSLSNIGSIGGTVAVPVLVVPQVAIGALGRMKIVPHYVSIDPSALPDKPPTIQGIERSISPSYLLLYLPQFFSNNALQTLWIPLPQGRLHCQACDDDECVMVGRP
jgi:2-oxoisovalerate dehydrogenase E2 component (dihydrolipoyl transacylase)